MSKLATAPMLLLAALLLVRAAAAEAGARLSASMAGTLERQAQLAARPAGHLEMRSSSSTVGARQEAVADYAARLKDALVGGQPPAPGTPGTFSTAAPHPLPHQHLPSTLRAPRSHSEQLTAAAPAGQKPTTSSYPARQQLSHGSISPTTAASLASQAMLRELVADAAEAAAASAALPLPPTQASTTVAATGAASKPSARATWSAELIFDRNASSFGFSNRWVGGVALAGKPPRACPNSSHLCLCLSLSSLQGVPVESHRHRPSDLALTAQPAAPAGLAPGSTAASGALSTSALAGAPSAATSTSRVSVRQLCMGLQLLAGAPAVAACTTEHLPLAFCPQLPLVVAQPHPPPKSSATRTP